MLLLFLDSIICFSITAHDYGLVCSTDSSTLRTSCADSGRFQRQLAPQYHKTRCFAALHQLRHIRRSVPPATIKTVHGGHPGAIQAGLRKRRTGLVGLLAYLVRRLQLVYHMISADHITDALACLHWLRVPQRIEYKGHCTDVQSSTRKCTAVCGTTRYTADLHGRRTYTLWWWRGVSRLTVPPTRRSTVSDRAFTVAEPRVWNTLPEEITTSQTLPTLCQRLKTWLFRKSYPDIII